MRIPWDPIHSPPLLHVERNGQFGLIPVTINQYHPYELVAKSKHLNQPNLFPLFANAVQSSWRLKNAYNQRLKGELKRDIGTAELPKDVLIEQLRWLVQNCPPQFQLYWPSV